MRYSQPSIRCTRKKQPPISANFAPPPVETGEFANEMRSAVEDQAGLANVSRKESLRVKGRVRCEEDDG